QEKTRERESVSLEDFWSYLPKGSYIFRPTREPWLGSSVDAKVPWIKYTKADGTKGAMRPTSWLDEHRSVEQMTWAPGEPETIEGKYLVEGGWIERPGARCFNLYMPPKIVVGDAGKAEPWLKHLRIVYPEEADHIVNFLAHRVQHPDVKC